MRWARAAGLLFCASLPAQTWREQPTGIHLPPRHLLLPASAAATGKTLHLVWLVPAPRGAALHYARFDGRRWQCAPQAPSVPRLIQPLCFVWQGRLHVFLPGRRPWFARRGKDTWEPLPLPVRGPVAAAAAASGPEGALYLLLVLPRRRPARHPRPGALRETLGKAFLLRLDRPKARPRALDPDSPYGVAGAALGVDRRGRVLALLARRRGPGGPPTVDAVSPSRPRAAVRVSRAPGREPALAVLSPRERIAFWSDRRGLVGAEFDGHRWLPPALLLRRGRTPRVALDARGGVHVGAWDGEKAFYLYRGPRGWAAPHALGPAAGPVQVLLTGDGSVHCLWQTRTSFRHCTRTPAPP